MDIEAAIFITTDMAETMKTETTVVRISFMKIRTSRSTCRRG